MASYNVTWEIVRRGLESISEEMGIALRNSSYSPNIKERMDHSAAIFDAECRLLAQAEHIPVHLGSLPWGLKNIVEECTKEGIKLDKGVMVVCNNPYIAGTHLNDVTLVRPVYYSAKLIAYVANKAHHSDVGGKVPGSISVDAKSLFEEGLIVNPTHLVIADSFVEPTLRVFASNTRTPHERLGDLRAQAAANFVGERRLLELINKYSPEGFNQAVEGFLEHTEKTVEARLKSLRRGVFEGMDYLEHPKGWDIPLRVKLSVGDEELRIDYGGTHPQVDVPLNAVFGVTLSGVYFVLRSILGEDVPVNHATFSKVVVEAPKGSILNPMFPAPVAGGNVETSQRNADLLFAAFSQASEGRVPAASGGSMNNLMMGGVYNGRSWAYYETNGVGSGGRPSMDGVNAVHTNMTNTMNTPIEEVERNLPVMFLKYEVRADSCGAGMFRGGCGLIRAFQALDTLTLTVLAERGKRGAWGLNGGKAGQPTKVYVIRRGRKRRLNVKVALTLNRGDVFELHTAGGGGYGDPKHRERTLILADLLNGYVTPSYAQRHYGFKHNGAV
ncbi:MAG: hydantoinase B/oxoprolinase family protein [Thermoprotei archaeon]